MPSYDILWNYEDEDGNVAHIAALMDPEETGSSRSSGRPIAFGYTPDSRYICVVYEAIARYTLYPVTAFVIED
jgi:hypothetical protein